MFALYIIVGWMVVAVVSLTYLYYRKELKMTSQTTGKVISAVAREVRANSLRRDETVVTARYIVGDKSYELAHVFPGKNPDRFPPGLAVPVKYNPSDPKMARILTA